MNARAKQWNASEKGKAEHARYAAKPNGRKCRACGEALRGTQERACSPHCRGVLSAKKNGWLDLAFLMDSSLS